MKRFANLTIVAVLCFAGFAGAQQPSRFDWLGVKEDVAKLKLEVAEIKADMVAIKAHQSSATVKQDLTVQPVGYVAVTKAVEHHPGLLNVAGAVATAPLRAVTRTVCGGNSCRQVTEWVPDTPTDSVQAAPAFQGDCSSGSCSGGSCGMQTRRGWFGRRR